MPGPPEPVYLAGHPVRAVLVWAPTSGHVGMSVSIFSYRGEVTMGLMVDAALVPEPGVIVSHLERELKSRRRHSRGTEATPGGTSPRTTQVSCAVPAALTADSRWISSKY